MRAATIPYSLLEPAGAPLALPAQRPTRDRPTPLLWQAGALPADDGAAALSTGHPALDAELPGGGWPQGRLIELLVDGPGLGELSLLAPALAALQRSAGSGRTGCLWVLPVQPARRPAAAVARPYAPALQAAGLDPARCVFVQPATPRESWWSLEQALRAGAPAAVVGWLPQTPDRSPRQTGEADFRALRRLHLLAGQQRKLVVVLRHGAQAEAPSPAALRLRLTAQDGRLQLRILKRRGRPLLDPIDLQVHPVAWRSARVAPSAGVAAPEAMARPPASSTTPRHWLQAVFAPLRG